MAGAATGCMRSWARGVYGGLREEEEEEDEANVDALSVHLGSTRERRLLMFLRHHL